VILSVDRITALGFYLKTVGRIPISSSANEYKRRQGRPAACERPSFGATGAIRSHRVINRTRKRATVHAAATTPFGFDILGAAR